MRRNLHRHEGRAARPWCLALAVLVTAAGFCLGSGTAKAQDVKSYTRATFDNWLTKYKDAKPDFKVGDVLTAKPSSLATSSSSTFLSSRQRSPRP
jgi:hypothetical protein